MSAVNEKLDAAETGYGSIKDEPKTGGGLKLIVIGMLIGAVNGEKPVVLTMGEHVKDRERDPVKDNNEARRGTRARAVLCRRARASRA